MKYAAVTVAMLVATAACSAGTPEAADDGAWAGTIATGGNVTTVINESGSVRGGTRGNGAA